MTILEKLQADMQYNEQHELFAPYDDGNMGQRYAGRYELIEEDEEGEYKRWFFDNGHNYTLCKNLNMLYECEPFPAEYFIHKHIEKAIYDIVTNNSKEEQPLIFCYENEVGSSKNPVVLIKVIINRESRNVCVTNIFVQMEKRHQCYGKQLISKIYAICKMFGYRLFLTEMVESFYNRMVRRGARIIEVGNVVEITDDTNLTPVKG